MLDIRPYLRRPIATIAAAIADPIETWRWVRDQYAIYREGDTPADLYKADSDWARELDRRLDIPSSSEWIAEFLARWPKVIDELHAKGVRAGPESFKGWNDGDAAFVQAIWCLT